MTAEIVHDDNIAGFEGVDKLCLDPSLEDDAVHGRIDDKRGNEAITLQTCNERLSFPVTKGCLGMKPVSHGTATAQPRHLGGCSGFINKYESVSLGSHDGQAHFFPFSSRGCDIGPVLFGRPQSFF